MPGIWYYKFIYYLTFFFWGGGGYSNKLKQLMDTYLMVNLFCITHSPLTHGVCSPSSLEVNHAISIAIKSVSNLLKLNLSHHYTWVSEDRKLPPQ